MQRKGKGKGRCRRWRWGGTVVVIVVSPSSCCISSSPVTCPVHRVSPSCILPIFMSLSLSSCPCPHHPCCHIPSVVSTSDMSSCPRHLCLHACIVHIVMSLSPSPSCPCCMSCPYPIILVVRSRSLSSLIPCHIVSCCLRCCKNIVSG
jgi:hypothetical protein